MNYEKIEKILKYKFKNRDLLRQAFTHSDVFPAEKEKTNERLAFIGDALIDFLASDLVFKQDPLANTSKLNDQRINVVRNSAIKNFVAENSLDEFLILGKSSQNSGGIQDSMRATLFEALFGAMYLDGCRMPSLKAKFKKSLDAVNK